MTGSFFHTFVCFLQIIFKKLLAKVYQELSAFWKKGTVYAIAAANAMVVFYKQNFGEFFLEAEALEAEAVCKYTASTSLVQAQ